MAHGDTMLMLNGDTDHKLKNVKMNNFSQTLTPEGRKQSPKTSQVIPNYITCAQPIIWSTLILLSIIILYFRVSNTVLLLANSTENTIHT